MLYCQKTLEILRETEANRQLKNGKIQQVEVKHVKEAEADDLETGEQPHTQSEEDIFEDDVNGELILTHSINGMSETTEADEECLDDVGTDNSGSPFWYAQPIHNKQKSPQKVVESQLTNEQRSFNHMAPNLDHFIPNNAADSLRYNTTGPHSLLLGGLPDVDYPTNEDNTLQLSHQPTEVQQLTADRRITTRRNSDSHSINQKTRRNSSYRESDDMDTVTESRVLSKNLKSSRLQRTRPVSTLQDPLAQMSNQDRPFTASNTNSSSNNDSDYNLNTKRNSIPAGQSSNSHRVLKLGSLKPNQGMFWSIHDTVSPDPQTLSESELPELNKRPKMKSQRSTSIPNISTEGGHEPLLPSGSMSILPQVQDTEFTISGHNLNGQSSLLEGVLERAKEKERQKDGLKRDRNLRTANLSSRCPPPSPSFSIASTPSPSDGDRETEWGEKEVELTRHRASTVSEGWKEQLVDEDDDEKRNKLVFNALFIM